MVEIDTFVMKSPLLNGKVHWKLNSRSYSYPRYHSVWAIAKYRSRATAASMNPVAVSDHLQRKVCGRNIQ